MNITRQEVAEAIDYALRKYGVNYPAFDAAVLEIIRQNRFSDYTLKLFMEGRKANAK